LTRSAAPWKGSGARKRRNTKEVRRPERKAQPKERSLKYENVRSAMAEEGVIRLLLTDASLIEACGLKEEEFSRPFLGSFTGN
jgi:DNA primase